MKVFDRDLIVTYDLDGDLIQLRQSTGDDTLFHFSILDKDRVDCITTIDFNNIEELEEVIKDFKETFNKIK